MPKETRRTPSEDKYRITTDPLKSLDDNVDSRFKHWEQVEHEAQRLEKQLAELQCALDAIPNTPEGRPKRADVRVRMVDLKRELDRLMRYNDQVEFFSCLASVLKTEEGSVHESQEPAPSTEEVRLSVTAPLKQRMRKKKNRARCSSVNMVTARSIVKLVGIKSGSKRKAVDCKRLGQLLREIPVDTAELEYCPSCPFKVALEHIEKPPSKCCPMCGLSTERIDETSSSVHDKDSAVHIPFTYRPKQHFYAWIKRVTGKLKFVIPQEVIDAVILELHNMRITDVNNVTWDIVNSILRDLAKKVDKKFSDYYQHVYQITNIIRGAPILTLTDVQEQELCNLFDVIFASWERHKEPDRDNFLSNAFVLQLCFHFLGYPEKIVSMFNILKGPENVKEYDRISQLICMDLGKPPVKLAAFADAKIGKRRNILEMMNNNNAPAVGLLKRKAPETFDTQLTLSGPTVLAKRIKS